MLATMSRIAHTLGAATLAATLLGTTGSAAKGTKKQARSFLKQFAKGADNAGLKLTKKAAAKSPHSYRVFVEATPFQNAFYTDEGSLYAPASTTSTWKTGASTVSIVEPFIGVSLRTKRWGKVKPTASQQDYFDRLAKLSDKQVNKLARHLTRKTELVRYTLDSDGSGTVDATDRKSTASAASKATDDFAMLRFVYGTELVDGVPKAKTQSSTLATGIALPLDETDDDAAKAVPVFSYRLSERFLQFDLNNDGDTEDVLLFGDSDSSGSLNATEATAVFKTGLSKTPDLTDNLDVDGRFKAGDGTSSLLERVKAANDKFDTNAAKLFIRSGIVRVSVSVTIEYKSKKRKAWVRQTLQGSADFRNSLLRLLGMQK